MPVIVKSNNYTNTFGYSGSTYVSNAGDTTTLSLVVSEKIRITTVNNPFTLDPLLNILTSPSQSWLDEGFRVGDLVYIAKYDSSGTFITSIFSQISSVSDTEINLTVFVSSVFYDISANEIMEVIAITNSSGTPIPRKREDLQIEFNHSLNDQSGSSASLIDGELSRVVFPNLSTLAIGSTLNGTFVGNKSGQFLQSANITNNGIDADNFFEYTITFVFVNSGLYNQSSFDLGDCLKIFVNGLWSSKAGETFKRTPFNLDEKANTGWFNEANNSSIPTGGSVVSPISELKYNIAPNTVSFEIDLGGTSISDLAIGGAYISIDDNYYKNKPESQNNLTYLLPTTTISASSTYQSNLGVGSFSGARWEFTVNSITTVGSNATVDLTWQGNTDFQNFIDGRADGDKLFYFWVKIGNTNHLIYNSQLVKDLPVGGPLIMNSDFGFLDHSQNDTSIAGNNTGFSADTEDDIAYYGTFNLELNKQTYNAINLRVEAYNTVTEDKFTLQQTNFSFAGVTYQASSGKYLLNEKAGINTGLPNTSEKLESTIILTGSDTATHYEVGVYYPFLLNWKYWIELIGANSDFAPNENQNWEQYDNLGNWTLRMTIELNDNNLAFVHSNTFINNPYDNNPDITSSIQLKRQIDNSVVTIIPSGDLLYIESTHILNTGNWDILKIWGMITIEPKESNPRSICSTIIPYDNNTTNPLTPISGLLCQMNYPSPNTITLKCKFDPSKIDTSKGVKITAKIKQGLNNIVILNKVTTSDVVKETTSTDNKIMA